MSKNMCNVNRGPKKVHDDINKIALQELGSYTLKNAKMEYL